MTKKVYVFYGYSVSKSGPIYCVRKQELVGFNTEKFKCPTYNNSERKKIK